MIPGISPGKLATDRFHRRTQILSVFLQSVYLALRASDLLALQMEFLKYLFEIYLCFPFGMQICLRLNEFPFCERMKNVLTLYK